MSAPLSSQDQIPLRRNSFGCPAPAHKIDCKHYDTIIRYLSAGPYRLDVLRLTMLQMEKHVCQWIRKAWTAKRRCSQDGTRTNVFNVRRRIAVLGLSDSDSFLFGLMPSDEIPSCCLVAINFDAECSLGRG